MYVTTPVATTDLCTLASHASPTAIPNSTTIGLILDERGLALMAWSRKAAAVFAGTIAALAVLFSSVAFGSKASGTDEPFVVEEVAIEEGSLQIILIPNRYGVELADAPVMTTALGQHKATNVAIQDGKVVLTFDQVTELRMVGMLYLGAISVPVDRTTEAPVAAKQFGGPNEYQYQVVDVEHVVLEFDQPDGSKEVEAVIHLRYQPADTSAPAVSGAIITHGSAMYRAVGFGSTYSESWELTQGVIRFPVEASDLLNSDDAVLHLQQFRGIESQEIDLGPHLDT